jgi:hypothetical protein
MIWQLCWLRYWVKVRPSITLDLYYADPKPIFRTLKTE